MADNEQSRDATGANTGGSGASNSGTTSTEQRSGDKKDVEKRGQASRRGPFKDKSDRGNQSSLDFDVDSPVAVFGGYMEEGTKQFEPFYQYGTFDTSGTGGGAPDMREVSPVFEISRKAALVTAARALDPSDPRVPRELVNLGDDRSAEEREENREFILAQAAEAVANPVEIGGLNPAQREAAEEYDDSEGGRASLGGAVVGTSPGKNHNQKPSLRDLDGDGADDRAELKQDWAEAKATVTQGSTGRREAAATQQGAQQAKGR